MAAGAAPAASAASAPLSPASAAALQAQRAQQALEHVQDLVAARWKARAAHGDFAMAAASATTAPPAQVTVKSEKLGTAPASPDVKTATKPATQPVLDRKSPAAAGPKP